MEPSTYRKIFRDIINGYSPAEVAGQSYYVKHLSSLDQVDIDDYRKIYYDQAVARGIPTEEEVKKDLEKDGVWTKEDELEISKLERFVEQLIKNKSQILLKSKLDQQNKTIESTRKKIEELKIKKIELLGVNAEGYADKRSNDYYIIKSFYHDKELTKLVFETESDYNELYGDEIVGFIKCYNEIFMNFEEKVIQTMILQDFYYIYFPFCDDTVGFFGHPVSKLTYNQLKLIVYTKIFKGILENNAHIPDKIKKDPQALLDYGNISDEAKTKMQQQMSSDKDASTLFGATDEDYEYAGLSKPSDSTKISLHKAAEKKGGSLSMEDLMELSGHRSK